MTLVSSVWREVTQKLGLLKALIGFCTIAGEESKRKAEPRTRSASRLSLAEMKRFELLRRFEPTYRISSADPSTTWVHLQLRNIHPENGNGF